MKNETPVMPQIVNILLVDDNDDDVLMVEDSLRRDGKLANLIHVVKDGEEAVAYLRKEGQYTDAPTPGLILLDINMPKKNGFEVLEEIRQDPKLRSIPVIMLTTSQREEDIVKSYQMFANTYVSKPVTFDKVRQVIDQLVMYWAIVAKLPEHR